MRSKSKLSPSEYYDLAYHNPLVDALPKIDLGEKTRDHLSWIEGIPDNAIRSRPIQERLNYLAELDRVHVCLNRNIELTECINSMIRSGYLGRGSVPKQRAASERNREKLQSAFKGYSDSNNTLNRLVKHLEHKDFDTRVQSLIGIPATGKTTTIERVMSLFPKAITFDALSDPRLPPMIVPGLHINSVADGTIPSFCLHVIRKLEKAIKDEVPKKFRTGNRSQLIGNVANLLQQYHVGVLVVDEFQNLTTNRKKPNLEMLNFILEISNTLQVPVYFVGTPAAQQLMTGKLRNARRLLGRAWKNFPPESTEWEKLLKTVWQYQFCEEFTPLNQELKKCIYHECVGLPGLLTRLMREVQRVLLLAKIFSGRRKDPPPEKITPAVIRAVANDIFRPISTMLNALRSGDPELLEIYDDLSFDENWFEKRAEELARMRDSEFLKTLKAVKAAEQKRRQRLKGAIEHEANDAINSPRTSSAMRMAEDSV